LKVGAARWRWRRDADRAGGGGQGTVKTGQGGRKKAIMYGNRRRNQSVLEKFKMIKAAGFDGVEPEQRHGSR